MITFLPSENFQETAKILDNRRLGSQRREAYGILMSHLVNGELSRHTVGRMWEGYTDALIDYTITICVEWEQRGFRDTIREKIKERSSFIYERPWWLGKDILHSSHRSNLLRKDPIYYGRFGWSELPLLPYYWPGGKSAIRSRDECIT